ncbi:hypothetical protein Taro_025526, partial [Colocasia esculenta]|nr:hypothetical protein [Colocasia esculenta]
ASKALNPELHYLYNLPLSPLNQGGEAGRPYAEALREERENLTQPSITHPLHSLHTGDVQEACFGAGGERPAEDYRALLLWPNEGGEVEVPPSPSTRGHCTDMIIATPWAQSTQSTGGSTWSTGDPFIANESPAASASIREIR